MKKQLSVLVILFTALSATARPMIDIKGSISKVSEFGGSALVCMAISKGDGRKAKLVLRDGGGSVAPEKFLKGQLTVFDRTDSPISKYDMNVFVDTKTSTIVAGGIWLGGLEIMPTLYFYMQKANIEGIDYSGTIAFDKEPLSFDAIPRPNAVCMVKRQT